MKLHLAVRPANEGARKLAQWIMRHCSGNLILARHKTRLDETMLQRMVDGEIVAGEVLVRQVSERMPRAIIARLDWQRQPRGGWFDSDGEPGSLGVKVAA